MPSTTRRETLRLAAAAIASSAVTAPPTAAAALHPADPDAASRLAALRHALQQRFDESLDLAEVFNLDLLSDVVYERLEAVYTQQEAAYAAFLANDPDGPTPYPADPVQTAIEAGRARLVIGVDEALRLGLALGLATEGLFAA